MPIAFFDSGVGGLTVFEKLKRILPYENYLYFGDTKNMPYGEKSEEQLIEFADKIFRFFEQKGVKAVVMACNTTSAVTYERLKDNYNFKIYPIIQSVTGILAQLPIERLGIFATPATIKSGVYSREIHKHTPQMQVVGMDCPEWVKIVEGKKENMRESVEIIQKDLTRMLVNKPEKIVLGCTHYPFLLPVLTKFAPEEFFIDPAIYFAEFIRKDLDANDLLSNSTNGKEKFFVSSSPENFRQAGRMFYPINGDVELVEL